mmetsp:Transcript_65221/g.155772  ORF Transcript_65221/g.155772 Transcript_65221/m.155772 type:complete len:147 (+) Transcript_65221:178-618(+)
MTPPGDLALPWLHERPLHISVSPGRRSTCAGAELEELELQVVDADPDVTAETFPSADWSHAMRWIMRLPCAFPTGYGLVIESDLMITLAGATLIGLEMAAVAFPMEVLAATVVVLAALSGSDIGASRAFDDANEAGAEPRSTRPTF